jgi:hypothetical protein
MKEVNPMDCAQFENIVHDIERPGTEGFALRDLALTHAESCSYCAQLMTETESLDAGLRVMLAAAATQTAPCGIEAALMAEFRRHHFIKARRRVQRQIAALGTAAAALLAVGFSLHHWPAHRHTPPPQVAGVRASPAGAAAPNSAAELDADDSEYAGSFTPLPYADDPSALEDGAVVRVEMPRAALASFGLPVAAMESDGTVRADLIVSADGTPQAIRLVPQDNAARE